MAAPLATSHAWKPKSVPLVGVVRAIELEGGLLFALPELDSGGVDGENEDAMLNTFVSKGRSDDGSCLKTIAGFRSGGCGDVPGVIVILP